MDEQVTTAPPPVEAPAPVDANDPFALDEAKFATLAPEQRAALDPLLNEWKTRARGEIEKTTKTWEEKYRPIEEKARALDELIKDQRFQGWWNTTVNNTGATQQTQQTAQPLDFATPEEYQQAISDAYGGNGTKLREIQARIFSAMATPVIQDLRKSQQELRTSQEEFRMSQEMRDLFSRHDDAKELDSIGRKTNDPTDTSKSLLEMCLDWAHENGKSLEEGYAKASSWRDALRSSAEQKAMGLIQSKKESVTSGPSTAKGGQNVVEVADADELMQKNMEYLANGQTPPKFVIRKAETISSDKRWGNKT